MIIIRVRDRAEFGVGETRNATLRPQKCHKWQIWANSPKNVQLQKTSPFFSSFDKSVELPHYNFLLVRNMLFAAFFPLVWVWSEWVLFSSPFPLFLFFI